VEQGVAASTPKNSGRFGRPLLPARTICFYALRSSEVKPKLHRVIYLRIAFYAAGIFFFVKGAIMVGTVKDAADRAVASMSALVTAAQAVVAYFQQNPPPDPNAQAIIDELGTAADSTDAEAANLNAIVNPPAKPTA
jgi:hypothetical protein